MRENTVRAITRAYTALQILPGHILRFDGPPPPGATGQNPYHVSVVKMPQYLPQWRVLYRINPL